VSSLSPNRLRERPTMSREITARRVNWDARDWAAIVARPSHQLLARKKNIDRRASSLRCRAGIEALPAASSTRRSHAVPNSYAIGKSNPASIARLAPSETILNIEAPDRATRCALEGVLRTPRVAQGRSSSNSRKHRAGWCQAPRTSVSNTASSFARDALPTLGSMVGP
jgi:hypothetical protein